jgi:hypothetical protein
MTGPVEEVETVIISSTLSKKLRRWKIFFFLDTNM